MVKCVVSGCPNRVVSDNRGVFNRPQKRFFNFPKDPARVKVWLAALRETDKQDSAEQHLICEDHFLPEDISTNEVNGDAIPIMPPCLDGPLGMISHWGAESSEDEDQWAAAATGGGGGGDGDDDDDDEAAEDDGGHYIPAYMEPAAPAPLASPLPATLLPASPISAPAFPASLLSAPALPASLLPALDPPAPDPAAKRAKMISDGLNQWKEMINTKTRQDVSLGMLSQRFLELLLRAPDASLDLRQVATSLQTRRRRVYDITNVLEGISLIEKQSTNRIKWIGSCPISSFLWKNEQQFQSELENLKLVEDTLDTLIKTCAQQLFDMTDDLENAALAYVTQEDISRLGAFQEQTVIVVKAPEETKLEVPAPKEDSIQVHLKGGNGPIMVLTCDIGTEEEVTGEKSGCFITLEESRITTATLHTESSSPQCATQSA